MSPANTRHPNSAGPEPDFVPGLELSRRFSTDAVRPLLEEAAPGVPHSAARTGSGSEVLGHDTPHSADHEWGPRLQVFLHRHDVPRHAARIRHILAEHLPKTFLGHPTDHHVEATSASTRFTATLGFDPGQDITPADWLAAPTQLLSEVIAGAVFHDGLHTLTPLRRALRWHPHDSWLYVLACQWHRVAREVPPDGPPLPAVRQMARLGVPPRL
ncbi:DUF4037 domain-containing protein [Streptomyces sp. NPDC051243]|uniref:DUF4037 domain-containing protein n=1 Tax=Streptomyces sp. NPDC051243 TaxID=3365646 RepID=UPI0037B868E2